MEISEDRRLRELGIDPDGDPIEIMMEVRRRALELRRLDAEKAKNPPPDAKI
jgi:Fe2+ transport system protein FeoA